MSPYSIEIAHRAKKQIDGLPPDIKTRVGDVILNEIALHPYEGKALKAKLEGLYSYRVGDYRIIYAVTKSHSIVQIIKVMHRREVYR